MTQRPAIEIEYCRQCRWLPRAAWMAPVRQAVATRGADDLRAYFLGAWHLARTIDDRQGPRNGFLRGSASFEPDGCELRYREAGRLRLGAYAGAVEQHYRYTFPQPDYAAIRFADGRPFFDLELIQGRGAFLHRCGADLYRGTLEILDASCFAMSWRVSGPRKDYVLRSRYRRVCGLKGVRPLQVDAACRIELPVRRSMRAAGHRGS